MVNWLLAHWWVLVAVLALAVLTGAGWLQSRRQQARWEAGRAQGLRYGLPQLDALHHTRFEDAVRYLMQRDGCQDARQTTAVTGAARCTPRRHATSSIPHVPRAVGGGMRETAEVLNGLLFAITPWLVLVAMALFLFPGPVQRSGVATLERFERLRADSGVRRAAPLLTQVLLLPPRIRDRVNGHGLTPGYVVRWWRARPLAGPFKIIRFVLLLYVVGHVDDVVDWEHLRWSANPGPHPGVMQELLSSFVAMSSSVATWDSSAISRVSVLSIVVLFLIAEVRFIKRVNLTSSGRGTTLAAYDLEGLTGHADGDSARMEDRRCWPVVVLLTVAAQCATVLRRWEETQPDCQIPRVSVQPVEHVIWRAHRTRRARARRHNERQFKAHAALVVGALRQAEARQDSKPGPALEDLTVMLLTIAERYAEGRIDDLLDADQLADVTPATPRERLRGIVVGLTVVLVMAGAAFLGLPDAALIPLLPVVVIFVAVVVNRGRMPTAGQLTDRIIPR
ncbi:hypothetical protein [Streptomyces sp. G3]|uniref:hypothetical protein n=1 Tax=Streptomyces sp. G3 TaxID=690144 RepID=UPI0027E4957D|nr:hypothetical protein [Streptomyces sp. G3]